MREGASAHLKVPQVPQGQVPDIFQLVNVIVSVIVSFLFTKIQRSFLRKSYNQPKFRPVMSAEISAHITKTKKGGATLKL